MIRKITLLAMRLIIGFGLVGFGVFITKHQSSSAFEMGLALILAGAWILWFGIGRPSDGFGQRP